MGLSKKRIENRLTPYLLSIIDPDKIGLLTADDFIDIFNSVAADLNDSAQIHIERFYKKTGADNSEDANYTNYLLNGVIRKILSFELKDDKWRDINYSYFSDRIVLDKKSTNAQMDIIYLRDVEDINVKSDEIDLPESLYEEYLSLLKLKIAQEYGDVTNKNYEDSLSFYTEKAQTKIYRFKAYRAEPRRAWLGQAGDDFTYLITKQFITIDNYVLGQDGNYTHVDL